MVILRFLPHEIFNKLTGMRYKYVHVWSNSETILGLKMSPISEHL